MSILEYTFLYFYHMDCANACVHTSNVKFSPITFRLAEALNACGLQVDKVAEVISHVGMYEEDKGR